MSETPRLHLQKLCVGVETVEDLQGWIDRRVGQKQSDGSPGEQTHTTRMTPKRADDILAGGSLYWVVKGVIQCRQRILELRPVVGEDGIRRCQIVLEPKLVLTKPRPRRPFQGWRYLKPNEAPPDLAHSADDIADMPEPMRRELAALGLL